MQDILKNNNLHILVNFSNAEYNNFIKNYNQRQSYCLTYRCSENYLTYFEAIPWPWFKCFHFSMYLFYSTRKWFLQLILTTYILVFFCVYMYME